MTKKFKIFVVEYKGRYWFDGDEGDGQYWVKDIQKASLYTEWKAKEMGIEEMLNDFVGQQIGEDEEIIESPPILREVKVEVTYEK